MQKTMPKILLSFILMILAVHLLVTWNNWYETTRLDIPMHIAGGAWIGLLFFYLFEHRFGSHLPRHWLARLVLALGFVALVGVGWEIFEFLATPGQGVFDTLKDLTDDLIGGGIVAIIMSFPRRRESS